MSDYHKLNHQDKHLIQVLAHIFNMNFDPNDDAFDKEFQIMVGEIRAGNDSKIIKAKVKKYILYAISIGKLSRQSGYNMISV